uniref:Calmodulin n=1 Tax=Chromera velia CCMP2878 TaxID=1169474 RepID=A0A0G4GNG5_9ALVE|mmetsp:Transcript_18327/g.37115  ORF Transcript_18327/g.37115 Transcript_18327/m.37115 type:complete len:153 (-) Transcript_18327:303-761(-)|eukprot:Cvel_22683.t1-p1 / transcript=Cvel_22683.t1 / gene=Cvel_22683 / organism=Chromera_velia_CCMP2878 / gene_product=Calmodulin-1, putative / transcript_product=Calmodulin-1, putative / location=Cvel_scaffold2257:14416-16461(-) / protein_length=152 / sequence_SO=supercontig / SO=protein_coding / is_pseudo=false
MEARAIDVFGAAKVQQIKHYFKEQDKGNRGTIKPEQIAIVMRTAGLAPTEDELRQFVSVANKRANGAVSLELFFGFCAAKQKDNDNFSDLVQVFHSFDPEQTGMISQKVFRNLMRNVGEPLTQDEVDNLIKDVCGGEDPINYRDFLQTILQK